MTRLLAVSVEDAHESNILTVNTPVAAALFFIVPVKAIEYVVIGVDAAHENCKELYVKLEVGVPVNIGVIVYEYVIAVVQFGIDYIVNGGTEYKRVP